jgi:DNA-binding response OmpR family regulator
MDQPPLILVVEDDASVRRLICRTLERHGYRVLEADSAFQAVSMALGLSETPGALVSDVVMPGPDGCQLASMLRQRWPGLPVLLVSGSRDLGPVEGPGPLGFLAKPFVTDVLLERLEGLMRRD